MDEINKNEEEVTTTSNEEEKGLLKAYKELQANSVSKEKYEKDIAELKEKNDIYLKAITEGEEISAPSEDSDNIQDVIADISNFKGTNLEYWQKMTKAIDLTLQTMPADEITKITGDDGLEELIKVNEGMKKMVKDSNGDPDLFRTIYKNKVTDSAPRISAEIEKYNGLYGYFEHLQNKK